MRERREGKKRGKKEGREKGGGGERKRASERERNTGKKQREEAEEKQREKTKRVEGGEEVSLCTKRGGEGIPKKGKGSDVGKRGMKHFFFLSPL